MNICMLAYTFYEADNRVRRYAEALVREGHNVDIVALKSPSGKSFARLNGVSIYRIQNREINEKGKLSYLFRVSKFFLKSFLFVCRKQARKPYNFIHVHSVPDFEVFAAVIAKIMGAKIILDIHDIVPEFYASKFNASKKGILFKALVFIEKISCKFSDHVIVSNHLWYKKLIKRSVAYNKCSVILNFPDTKIFSQNCRCENEKGQNEVILIYPGTLNWHQGLDIAVKAFAVIKDKVPFAKFFIYGKGPLVETLNELINKLDLNGKVMIMDPVPLEDIAHIMGHADIGVIPKRNDDFGGEAFSTKTLEFMVLKVPIIVSKTVIDSYYYNDDIVTFFEPDNVKDLAAKMLTLITDKGLRDTQADAAYSFAKDYMWSSNQKLYFDLIDSLNKN